MIKVEGLTKRYDRTVAVDNISFEVEKGQIVGFLGPNGAGKTTTMRVLTCFLPPTSGTATVAGFDVLQNPMEVKKRIGYLPETPPLYPEMEVIEYLNFVGQLKGIAPGNILGVTFTNKAAREMQERVGKLLPRSVEGRGPRAEGKEGSRRSTLDARPTICTFHSLCARILRQADRAAPQCLDANAGRDSRAG